MHGSLGRILRRAGGRRRGRTTPSLRRNSVRRHFSYPRLPFPGGRIKVQFIFMNTFERAPCARARSRSLIRKPEFTLTSGGAAHRPTWRPRRGVFSAEDRQTRMTKNGEITGIYFRESSSSRLSWLHDPPYGEKQRRDPRDTRSEKSYKSGGGGDTRSRIMDRCIIKTLDTVGREADIIARGRIYRAIIRALCERVGTFILLTRERDEAKESTKLTGYFAAAMPAIDSSVSFCALPTRLISSRAARASAPRTRARFAC